VSLMSRRKDPSYEGVPEEIERLADLRDKGVISDKDFQNLKKQLIQGDDLQKQETLGDDLWADAAQPRRGPDDSDRTERRGSLPGSVRRDDVYWDERVREYRAGVLDLRPLEAEERGFPGDSRRADTEPPRTPRGGLPGSVRSPSYLLPEEPPRKRPDQLAEFRTPPISSRNRGYVEVYYCANCNKRVGKTAKFCKNCGLQL